MDCFAAAFALRASADKSLAMAVRHLSQGRHSGRDAQTSSRESIATILTMDSGLAHPSRPLPTWTVDIAELA
jgi:hypothetical protein